MRIILFRNDYHLLESEHDLRRPVPSCGDILRHNGDVFGSGVESTAQAKVTYLEFAVGVHKQVAWFQVTVYDRCCMDVLQACKGLNYEISR